jgi:hypothetical protein
MDGNECNTVIRAARSTSGKTTEEILSDLDAAAAEFDRAAEKEFGGKGEW